MDVMSLVARISLDTSEYDSSLIDSEQKAYSVGQKIGSALNTAGKVAGAAMAATLP